MTMRLSTNIMRTILLILTSALLNSFIQANAYWTKVYLRIEGRDRTLFERYVLTTGHIVTTALGGTHECDGTNNGAHTTPGATIVSAIDDAVSTWDGDYDKSIRDYKITSIENQLEEGDERWRLLIGYGIRERGCQSQVVADDHVLVAFGDVNVDTFLKMKADRKTVDVNGKVVFTVTNGVNGKPVKGANIVPLPLNGGTKHTTDDNGKATIPFTSADKYKYKAEMDGAIRSNVVVIRVENTHPAGY